MIYAIADKVQFFKICRSGSHPLKLLYCDVSEIADMYEDTPIHMVAHPLVVKQDASQNASILADTIKDMVLKEKEGYWEVVMTSGTVYRLLV